MRFVMLVRVDPDLAATTTIDDVEPWVAAGTRSGVRLEGGPLEDPSTATTVRVRDGEMLLSDGPYTETKEIVAGYDLLEAPDLEAAVEFAGRHPVAAIGALEVRGVRDDVVADRDGAMPPTRPAGIDYLFLHVPDPMLRPAGTGATGDPTPWVRSMEDRGTTLGGARLQDGPDTSVTVRSREGELLISRGPFAAMAEQVAGVDLIRAADLDEAIAIAAAHPTAHVGAIEIRPFVAG